MIKDDALELLKQATKNPNAEFRDGQWEAIDALANRGKKLLVVQATGWGKSLVYFLSTRILRNKGKGITIIISPLLALMRNQIEAAERLGIKAATINSTNVEDWDPIKAQILANQVDALLISPERLANSSFVENVLKPIANNVGMFVVDEAHCISDWGHDFRRDYVRITNIIKLMPEGMPILGTTATANDRVVKDVVAQLGNIEVIRGPLARKSLKLQTIELHDQAARLAWLKENIPQLPGSGIVYTLTQRDALVVSKWLNKYGIESAAYYSGVEDENFETSDDYRCFLESSLDNNDLKVLVATSALGMGYDKPDLGFVIHYQAPGSIISYYQQVGRAGRAIHSAFGILLAGKEDQDIQEYFRLNAFPSEARVDELLKILSASDGLSVPDLMTRMNLRKGQIEQILDYLAIQDPSPVYKNGSKWTRTAVPYRMDTEKIRRLTEQKQKEWQQVQEYVSSEKCNMNFLQEALDDEVLETCGKCAICKGSALLNPSPAHETIIEAALFLKHAEFEVKLPLQVKQGALTTYSFSGNLPVTLRADKCKVLSRWGDAGWGRIVARDKHKGYFGDELVQAMADMIMKRWKPSPTPAWITCLPSLAHPDLVPAFTERLASLLNLPFLPLVRKVKSTQPQKEQENSYFQCANLDGAFQIEGSVPDGPVLLIDDAIDSGWTLALISTLLLRAGSGTVHPVALTSTSVS